MSRHFTEIELIHSLAAQDLNIPNNPSDDIKKQMLFTMAGLERVRACLGNLPIQVLSGYRCDALNKAVGGAENSQHMKGEAVDFVCPQFGTPKDIASKLSQFREMLGIDQLIAEGTWVHVSFTLEPRCEALTMRDGKYFQGII